METRNRTTLFSGLVWTSSSSRSGSGRRWHTYQIGGTRAASASSAARRRTVTLIRQLRPAVGAPPRDPGGRLHRARIRGVRQQGDGRGDGALARELVPSAISTLARRLRRGIHLFLGTGLSQGNAEPELYEEIATVRMPIGEHLPSRIGEIRDGKR